VTRATTRAAVIGRSVVASKPQRHNSLGYIIFWVYKCASFQAVCAQSIFDDHIRRRYAEVPTEKHPEAAYRHTPKGLHSHTRHVCYSKFLPPAEIIDSHIYVFE
jgi:hypothetical protein